MPKFRVVLKVPATLYAYHDIEAASREALESRLAIQANVNQIVGDGEGYAQEVSEPDESQLDWKVDEIGAAQ